eukprot:5335987-Ditylum_brightwellii.AAC.1
MSHTLIKWKKHNKDYIVAQSKTFNTLLDNVFEYFENYGITIGMIITPTDLPSTISMDISASSSLLASPAMYAETARKGVRFQKNTRCNEHNTKN